MRTADFYVKATVLAALLAGCGGGGTKPTVRDLAPQAVCPSSASSTITLAGQGFSPMVASGLGNHPSLDPPRVSLLRTLVINGTGESGPAHVELDRNGVRWAGQGSLSVDIGPASAIPGLYTVAVTNANGETTVLKDALLVVPPPAPRTTQPFALVANSNGDVVLQGDFFVAVGDAMPTVQLTGSDIEPLTLQTKALDACRPMPGSAGLQTCSQLTFTPPATLAAGNYAIEIVDPAPANCTSNALAQRQGGALPLTVITGPKLTTVASDVACNVQGDVALTLTGTNFLLAGNVAPALMLGTTAINTVAAGCAELPLEPGLAPRPVPLATCTQLTATIPVGTLAPGTAFDAVVQNPSGSGTTADKVGFFSEPVPALGAATAGYLCTAGGQNAIALDGSGFVVVDGQQPAATLGGTTAVAKAGKCQAGFRAGVAVCSQLTVTLPATSAIGTYPLAVANPGGAGCASQQTFDVVNVPPPTVTGVTPATGRICSAVAGKFTVKGTNFLFDGVNAPTVALGGGGKLATVPKNCGPMPGAPLGSGAQVCTALEVDVPAGALAPNPAGYALTVKNPAPADCKAAGATPLFVEPAPTISGATLSSVVGGAAIIFVNGTGFAPGALISVSGVPTSGGAVVSSTSAIAVVATGAVPGAITVNIDNGDGCAASAHVGLGLFSAPNPLARSGTLGGPASVFGGATTAVRFAAPGPVDTLRSASLRNAGGRVAVVLSSTTDGALDVVIPANTAAGVYDAVAVDAAGAELALGTVEVVSEAALPLGVTPVNLAQGSSLALEVSGAGLTDPASPEPLAWLVSADIPGTVAVGLAVNRAAGLEVTVDAANLKPGDYDLVVVVPASGGLPAQAGVVSRAVRVQPRGTGSRRRGRARRSRWASAQGRGGVR